MLKGYLPLLLVLLSACAESPSLKPVTDSAPVIVRDSIDFLESNSPLASFPVTNLDQDTVVVKMAMMKRFASFAPGRWVKNSNHKDGPWANMVEGVRDIPGDLEEVTIRSINLQLEQTAFYGLKTGLMPEDFALMWLGNKDTTRLTPYPVDHTVSMLVGYESGGNLAILFDTNNDESFLDEKRYVYDARPGLKLSANERKELPLSQVSYQYFDGEQIVETEAYLQADPYFQSEEGITGIFRERKKPPRITVTLAQHRVGRLQIRDQEYVIRAHNSFGNGVYWKDRSKVRISTVTPFSQADSSWTDYDIGHTILIDTTAYQIVDISLVGDEITLVKTNHEALSHTQVGGLAKDIVGYDFMTNNPVSLRHLTNEQDKYILLDFWGSWCPPCVAEIPMLTQINKKYGGERFEIIGIAYDEEATFESFLIEHEIDWVQILQTPEDYPLITDYQIYQYPTLFLISPDGLIKEEGRILRDSLEEVIARYVK